MANTVIKVEQLSKVYRLGAIGTGSLRQDLQSLWNEKVLKRENPFFLMTEEEASKSKNLLWALKEVNFEVQQGEAFGIIGSNGSGKSTLLKIISRIVRPTRGTVKGKGKISSLLEIGTGFHQELSGRENIFNSGYTLGMNKWEIKQKFDEIVEFSGVERFIDTPVKRYSSGMYVRLAFAVAAHLEPDILIIDEVLAVGDADFQLKCLGKMQEVSTKDGRTILFVSHNMQAVANLCTKTLWLEKGKIREIGTPGSVVQSYLSVTQTNKTEERWKRAEEAPGNDFVRMKSFKIKPLSSDGTDLITVNTPIEMEFEFWNYITDCNIEVNTRLYTLTGECVFDVGSRNIKAKKGILTFFGIIQGNLLNNSTYSMSLMILKNNATVLYEFSDCAIFKVEDISEGVNYFGPWPGVIRPHIEHKLSYKKAVEDFG